MLINGGVAPCPELGRGGGVGRACPCGRCGQGWKQTGLGCGAALPPPGTAADQSPSPPAPFSAGNETSSNYSSQARKSGRSRGSGLTQLRSAVSGHAAQSPFLLLFIRPAEKKAAKLPTWSRTEGLGGLRCREAERTGGGNTAGVGGAGARSRDGAARVT